MRRGLALLLAGVLAAPSEAFAAGDVQDQFYRHVEIKNKVLEPHLPGEVVDHFTGTLRILQEDLVLPGKAGLDLKIVRSYFSRISGRAQADSITCWRRRTLSLGFGWAIHMGRLQRPTATGQPLTCGGGDYPVYEAPDGTARTFYPLPGGFTRFVSGIPGSSTPSAPPGPAREPASPPPPGTAWSSPPPNTSSWAGRRSGP